MARTRLPGLQGTRSLLVVTAIFAVLITIWHLPLFILEGCSLPTSTIVGGIIGPFATFIAMWLFNHTGGSVVMTVLLHAADGSIQAEGWVYTGPFVIVAIGLVIFDWKSSRSPAPPSARTPAAVGGRQVVGLSSAHQDRPVRPVHHLCRVRAARPLPASRAGP